MLGVTWLREGGGGGVNCGCEICRNSKSSPLYICRGELWAGSDGEKVSVHLYPRDILHITIRIIKDGKYRRGNCIGGGQGGWVKFYVINNAMVESLVLVSWMGEGA